MFFSATKHPVKMWVFSVGPVPRPNKRKVTVPLYQAKSRVVRTNTKGSNQWRTNIKLVGIGWLFPCFDFESQDAPGSYFCTNSINQQPGLLDLFSAAFLIPSLVKSS